jgi:hypothetical protein
MLPKNVTQLKCFWGLTVGKKLYWGDMEAGPRINSVPPDFFTPLTSRITGGLLIPMAMPSFPLA